MFAYQQGRNDAHNGQHRSQAAGNQQDLRARPFPAQRRLSCGGNHDKLCAIERVEVFNSVQYACIAVI
jgi:hypothetical protein